MTYRCLTRKTFLDLDGYKLVPVRQEDLELIRQWRNEQVAILRQIQPLSAEQQQTYFETTLSPSFEEKQPTQILLTYLYQEKCIGYGGLTHIDWESKRAEVSFLLDTNRAQDMKIYEKDHLHFLGLVCLVSFIELKFHRLFTETFAFRTDHIHHLENFGFKPEGLLRDHVYKLGRWTDSIIHGLLVHEWEAKMRNGRG